jgi:hypothetical protein
MAHIPEQSERCNSWVIIDRSTGKPICETFEPAWLEQVDGERFEILTTLEWLQRYNRLVKEAGGVEPTPEAFHSAS